MDFNYLLELARDNAHKSKTDNSFKFSTKVPSAKKLNKGGPKVEAINNVLSKIEKEKRKKDEEFVSKRNQLLALREKDKHSKKRVRSLINRTKGASKAVLEDAKDLTTAKGEEQCDEDDYGYESTISQQIFSKLQNKYSELPEDDRLKFQKTQKSNIEDIKNRVMSSLKQKQEEELGIRKRKRKRRTKAEIEGDDFINDGDEYKKFGSDSEKNTENEGKTSKSSKKTSSELSVSNHNKVDRYSNFKYDKDKLRDKEKSDSKATEKEKKHKKSANSRARAPPPMSFEDLMKVAQKKQADPSPVFDPLKELIEKKEKNKKEDERPLTAKEKKELEDERIRKLRKAGKLPPEKNVKSKEKTAQPPKEDLRKPKDNIIKENKIPNIIKENKIPKPPQVTKTLDKSKYFSLPRTPVSASKNVPSKDTSTKSSNSKSKIEKQPLKKPEIKRSKIDPKELPPPSFPRKAPAPPPKRRIDSDEEEEYDSEMDDFIDDGEEDLDYSNEIAKLFKYDKSKYRDVDDDIDDMEASFTQLEKEEKISAKIGLMEDLEDIKREEEEKKRKKLLKKRKF